MEYRLSGPEQGMTVDSDSVSPRRRTGTSLIKRIPCGRRVLARITCKDIVGSLVAGFEACRRPWTIAEKVQRGFYPEGYSGCPQMTTGTCFPPICRPPWFRAGCNGKVESGYFPCSAFSAETEIFDDLPGYRYLVLGILREGDPDGVADAFGQEG